MKHIVPLLIAAILVGCASHKDDPRLQGTWRPNWDASCLWTNADRQFVERYLDTYGRGTITFSNGLEIDEDRGNARTNRYWVVKQGPDFVVIRSDLPWDKGCDFRIRFVGGDSGYWFYENGSDARFYRVPPPANQGGANGRQPPGLETNRIPRGAASSRSP